MKNLDHVKMEMEEAINVLKQDHVVIAKKDLPEGLVEDLNERRDPAGNQEVETPVYKVAALVAEQLEEKNMSKDKMPDVIWLNNVEFKMVDALRQKEPRAIGSTKYHHDRKYKAALDALEVAKGALSCSLAELMSNTSLFRDTIIDVEQALGAIDAVLEGEK